jgi:hypothetical protein
MPTPAPAGRRAAEVLLGLFVFWQLFFLGADNCLRMFGAARSALTDDSAAGPAAQASAPRSDGAPGHVHQTTAAIGEITRRWSQLTAQPQNWSLFAPEVGADVDFVAVELRWDVEPLSARSCSRHLAPLAGPGGLEAAALAAAAHAEGQQPDLAPVWLPSDNEPADLHRYFRAGSFRIRRYEYTLDLPLAAPEPDGDAADAWRAAADDKVRDDWRSIRAYLSWRIMRLRRERPGLPVPRQAILLVRRYRIPPPDRRPWTWEGPEQFPLARWQPGAEWSAGYLPVEVYNPVVGRFERIR